MPTPPCIYRDLADEAWRVDAETGAETRTEVWLCTWPTTIAAAPPGIPATGCVACKRLAQLKTPNAKPPSPPAALFVPHPGA